MAYQIYKFDDVLLPVNNSDQTHTPGDVESSIQSSVGGSFDYYGSSQKYPSIIPVDISGWYVGELANEVDAIGTYIVDDSGAYIVTHDANVDVRVKLAALQSKIGAKASLYRRWLDDTTTEQWKTARLLSIPYQQSYEDAGAAAELSVVFETLHTGWRSASQSYDTVSVSDDVNALIVYNGGDMRVDDATIAISASGSDITSVEIDNAADGINILYTGTIVDGTSVYIDCGAGTVKRHGVDSYDELSFGSTHTARGWLPLEPGNSLFEITVAGQGSVQVGHYNQWA